MGPIGHTALSTAIGVTVWKATGIAEAVPAAIVTGVLIDGDHILDWADWAYFGYRKHVIVLLHAWELAGLLLVSLLFWQSPIFVAAVLGYVGHVVSDHLLNPTYRWTYFLSYRAYRKFRREWLEKSIPPDPDVGSKPLWATFEPSLWKMVRWGVESGARWREGQRWTPLKARAPERQRATEPFQLISISSISKVRSRPAKG